MFTKNVKGANVPVRPTTIIDKYHCRSWVSKRVAD